MNLTLRRLNYKKIFIIIFPIPLLFNLLFNIYKKEFFFAFQNTSKELELTNLIIAFLLFIFYLNFGYLLKKIFNTQFISSAIVCFWLSIFSIENTIVFFKKDISVMDYLNFIFFILIINLIFKKEFRKKIVFLIFYALFLNFFTFFINANSFESIVDKSQLYTSDELKLWYPSTKIIYENSYFDVLINNPYPGYGLFTSYINAFNSLLLNINNTFFHYLPSVSYLFIFLFFFFIYEVSKSKKTFYLKFIIYISIILSSNWFTYVFFGSLLSEVVACYCFGVLFTEISNNNKNTNKVVLYLFLFGYIFYTRQFLSTLVLLYILFKALRHKNIYYLFGLIPFLIKVLQSRFLTGESIDPYANSNTIRTIYFNLDNVLNTFKQFAIDRPVTYLTIGFFILSLTHFKNVKDSNEYYIFITLNILFVMLLVIFFWNKSEVQSTYRYLLNTFYLTVYPICKILDEYFLTENELNNQIYKRNNANGKIF